MWLFSICKVALLFSLWTETVRPYLEIVDEWIVHGHLFDPAKEFIIQRYVFAFFFLFFQNPKTLVNCASRNWPTPSCRNKDVPVNHRDFWYATYTLYSVSETVENEERVSDVASGSSGGDQSASNRQLTMVSFLKPVLKQIIMAGKSMQLLKNLDCKEAEPPKGSSRGQCSFIKWNLCFPFGLAWFDCDFNCGNADAERKSLYTLFLESVQSRLCRQEESPTDTVTEQKATEQSLIKMQAIIAQHLETDDIHDPLLAINFARWEATLLPWQQFWFLY